ncbi:MAG TPA: DUF3108 domain-containing protein [Candidatus Kapabacteria bacterium]|nr:DUF3108 domain-containing protein [Candidatus Kapabacteria bacterium]HOM04726.1 DUF3108 domain-containing protein [Candidatus Kapabacteria bacterium]HPP39802.1 DUF3108 domain-containing protein [Candidatus Kapabacteria bacterium]
MKFRFLILSLLLVSIGLFSAQSQTKIIMQPGEELEYEVSFFNIKLGKIKIVTEQITDYRGNQVYRAKSYMESYSGIPFVDLKAIYSSWIDTTISFSHRFEGSLKLDADRWAFQKILFNYDENLIYNEKYEDKVLIEKLTTPTTRKINDGLSLFFLARQYTNMKRSVKVPTLMDTKIGTTYLNFHGKKENVQIPAIKYPVKTIYFDGRADWEGVYGLSGKFEGWFSDDDARVPIRAKMNVYVGNVVIELIRWKRDGWTPPRG